MKLMRLTNKQVNEVIAQIRTDLKTGKISNGKVNINYTLPEPKHGVRASVVYSEIAINKIRMLVDEAKNEVGWHGVARRDEENPSVFYIDDIFVFPQEVTGTAVNPDATEYAMWLSALSDDVFNTLRFHGHSHVNMPCTPSSVDTTFQDDILKNLNDFYIFAIYNKRDANWMTIFDVTNNVIYEDKDIIYSTQVNPERVWAIEQLDTLVTERKYTQHNKGNTAVGKNTTVTKGTTVTSKLSPGEKSMQEARTAAAANADYYGTEWYERFYGNGHSTR